MDTYTAIMGTVFSSTLLHDNMRHDKGHCIKLTELPQMQIEVLQEEDL